MARMDREELRALIGEALKEALAPSPPCGERVADPKGRLGEGTAIVGSQALVSPAPSRPSGPATPSPQGGGEGAYRHASGVLTEAKVAAVAKSHTKIVIGADVAVTPLARDKARELKLELVREAP